MATQLAMGRDRISLCETLDRVLNKGVVVAGEIVISVAEIDLIYLGLQVTLTSVETANELKLTVRPRGSAGVQSPAFSSQPETGSRSTTLYGQQPDA